MYWSYNTMIFFYMSEKVKMLEHLTCSFIVELIFVNTSTLYAYYLL